MEASVDSGNENLWREIGRGHLFVKRLSSLHSNILPTHGGKKNEKISRNGYSAEREFRGDGKISICVLKFN